MTKRRKRIKHMARQSHPGDPFRGEMMTCAMCGKQPRLLKPRLAQRRRGFLW